MQGGCVCENAPSLRLQYSNVQIAACTAPRPLHLISCTGDWTQHTPTEEFPDIRSVYKLYGAEDKVSFYHQEANHNYNFASRQSCYEFFGKVFLGETDGEKLREQPFTVESDENLLSLPDKRPAKGSLSHAGVMRTIACAGLKQWYAAEPKDKPSLKRFRKTFGAVLQHTLSIAVPTPQELTVKRVGVLKAEGYAAEKLLLGRRGEGDQVPALIFEPAQGKAKRPATVIAHEYGKAALMAAGLKAPGPLVAGLLAAGHAVVAVDVMMTGEFNAQGGMQQRRLREVRLFNTYNHPDCVEQAQDILTAIAAVGGKANVIGIGEAGLWAMLAAAAAPEAVQRLAADLNGFNPAEDGEFLERLPIPHIRRAGDLVAMAALIAPTPTLLHNLCDRFDVAAMGGMYKAAGDAPALTARPKAASEAAILKWVLG